MGDSCKKFVVPTEVSKWCHFTHTFEFTFCQHWVLFMQMRMTFEDVCNIICCSLAQAWHGTSTSRGGHCVSQSCHRNEQHVLGMVTHTTRYSVHLTMQCPRKERDEMSGCTREMTRTPWFVLALPLRLLPLRSRERRDCAWRVVTSQANTHSGFPEIHLQMP